MKDARDGGYFLRMTKSRRTVYEFTDEKIRKSSVQKILEAGRWTPSPLNTQPWHFIITTGKNRIEDLVEIAYYGAFHTTPAMVVSIVMDSDLCEGGHHGVKNNKIGTTDGALSVGMAALNMILEAQDLGISSCILSPESGKAAKILKLEKNDTVPIMIGFGYEKAGSYKKRRERKPLPSITSYEFYGGAR